MRNWHNLRGIFALLLSATISQSYGQSTYKYPPTGKLVDAGGHLLHLHIMGKGKPSVIMESGSGDFSFIWDLVQPEIAKSVTTVSYDRAGHAWSEEGPLPRSGRQIAYELHTALHNAGITGPYILVGQSYGGFLIRSFAKFYRSEVAGMVLVDALNEDSKVVVGGKPMRIREWAKGEQAPSPQNMVKKNKTPDTGSTNLDTTLEPPMDKLPLKVQQMQIWAQSQPLHQKTGNNEMTWSPEDVSDMYANRWKPSYMLGNIPLIVLSRGAGSYTGMADSTALENERVKLQDDLTHLSTNSKHIVDEHSGHNIHVEDPTVVIDAIQQVIRSYKTHKKLSYLHTK